MNFSTNQVMQFYVLDGAAAEVKKPLTGGALISFAENGEVKTSDKIENVMWGKLTEAPALARSYKKMVVSFNDNPIVPGQHYVVRVSYPEVGGLGVEGYTTKTASVFAGETTTPADVYESLAKDFSIAFEPDGMLVASSDSNGLVITQSDLLKKHYKKGVRSIVIIDFEVNANKVVSNSEDQDWANISIEEGALVGNGYTVSDMEWFAMGERGDQYRMMGWPDVYDTEYKVNDPSVEYDILNVHFAYKGDNATSYRSEKDLVVVAARGESGVNADLLALAKELSAATGVKFTHVTADGESMLAE